MSSIETGWSFVGVGAAYVGLVALIGAVRRQPLVPRKPRSTGDIETDAFVVSQWIYWCLAFGSMCVGLALVLAEST